MTPRVLPPTEHQAEDVVVVAMWRGWELIVTEGSAVLAGKRWAIKVRVGDA